MAAYRPVDSTLAYYERHSAEYAASTAPISEPAQSRLESLTGKANERQLTAKEAREYDRFVEPGDNIVTLRLKAGRQMQGERIW